MGDLSPSASLCSCHSTQWVGVAMIENKHSSSQTSDMSCACDKSPPPPHERVSMSRVVMGRMANHCTTCRLHVSCLTAVLFFALLSFRDGTTEPC